MSKKSWPKIGDVRTDIKGNRNIIFAKNVTILVDGEEVPLGQFRLAKCQGSVENVQRLAELGYLTDEQLTDKLAYIEEKNIKFDVVIPPANS